MKSIFKDQIKMAKELGEEFQENLSLLKCYLQKEESKQMNTKIERIYGVAKVIMSRYIDHIEQINRKTLFLIKNNILEIPMLSTAIKRELGDFENFFSVSRKIRRINCTDIQRRQNPKFKFSSAKEKRMTRSQSIDQSKYIELEKENIPQPQNTSPWLWKRRTESERLRKRSKNKDQLSALEMIEERCQMTMLAKRQARKERYSSQVKKERTKSVVCGPFDQNSRYRSPNHVKQSIMKKRICISPSLSKKIKSRMIKARDTNAGEFKVECEPIEINSDKMDSEQSSTHKSEEKENLFEKLYKSPKQPLSRRLTKTEFKILQNIKDKKPVFTTRFVKGSEKNLPLKEKVKDLANKVIKAHDKDLPRQTLRTQNDINHFSQTQQPFDRYSFHQSLLASMIPQQPISLLSHSHQPSTPYNSSLPEFIFLNNSTDSSLNIDRVKFRAFLKRDIGPILAASKINKDGDIFMVAAVSGLYFTFFKQNDPNVYVKKLDSISPRLHFRFNQIVTFYEQNVVCILDSTQGILLRYCLKTHRIMKCSNIDMFKPKYIINRNDEQLLVALKDGRIAVFNNFGSDVAEIVPDFIYVGFSYNIDLENNNTSILDSLTCVEFVKDSLFFVSAQKNMIFSAEFVENGKELKIGLTRLDIPSDERVTQISQFNDKLAIAACPVQDELVVSRILVYKINQKDVSEIRKIYLFSQQEPLILEPGMSFLRMMDENRVGILKNHKETTRILIFSENEEGAKRNDYTQILEQSGDFTNQNLYPYSSGKDLWIFGAKLFVQRMKIEQKKQNENIWDQLFQPHGGFSQIYPTIQNNN